LKFGSSLSSIFYSRNWIPPRVIDNNNSIGFDEHFCKFKTGRAQGNSFFVTINDDHIRRFILQAKQVGGLAKGNRIVGIKGMHLEVHVGNFFLIENKANFLRPFAAIFGTRNVSSSSGKKRVSTHRHHIRIPASKGKEKFRETRLRHRRTKAVVGPVEQDAEEGW